MRIHIQHINGQGYSHSVDTLQEADAFFTGIRKNYPVSYVSFYRKEYGDFVMLLPEFINKCTIFIKPESAEESEELKNA